MSNITKFLQFQKKKEDDVKVNEHQPVIQHAKTNYIQNNNNNNNNNNYNNNYNNNNNNNYNNNNNNDNNNNNSNNSNNNNKNNDMEESDGEINYDNMPLPEGWEKSIDSNGNVFYIDHKKRKTQWEHPLAKSQ